MLPTQEYCLFGLNHWSTCMQKAEWASWAQLVGSIVAMYVAFMIGHRQSVAAAKLEASRRAADRNDRLGAFVVVLRAIELTVVGLRSAIEHPGEGPQDARFALMDSAVALESFKASDLSDMPSIGALMRLPRMLGELSELWGALLAETGMGIVGPLPSSAFVAQRITLALALLQTAQARCADRLSKLD